MNFIAVRVLQSIQSAVATNFVSSAILLLESFAIRENLVSVGTNRLTHEFLLVSASQSFKISE